MNRFVLRWAINAVALYVAIVLVPGINAQNTSLLAIIGLALIFGAVNALIRPLLTLLTCPLILLTLGLFTLVINTLMFYLAGAIGTYFNIGFSLSSFWAALLGSIVVSVVSFALSLLLREELKPKG